MTRDQIGGRPFYFGKGCKTCNGTGYKGRRGVFEYLRMSNPLRELVNNKAPTLVIREKARELRKTDWWKALIAKGECHYCHKVVGAENLTMDHVIPVARGGKSVRSNCVPCCKDCNNKKKAVTPAEQILNQLFGDGPVAGEFSE